MRNNKQQTAVEWLVEQLRNNENIRWRGTNIIELGEQAKEMESRQIMNAFHTNSQKWFCNEEAEQYYQQTYGGGEQ